MHPTTAQWAAIRAAKARKHGGQQTYDVRCSPQVVERVNKLVFVRPLKTRYDAAQGDVVVGRVTEV